MKCNGFLLCVAFGAFPKLGRGKGHSTQSGFVVAQLVVSEVKICPNDVLTLEQGLHLRAASLIFSFTGRAMKIDNIRLPGRSQNLTTSSSDHNLVCR